MTSDEIQAAIEIGLEVHNQEWERFLPDAKQTQVSRAQVMLIAAATSRNTLNALVCGKELVTLTPDDFKTYLAAAFTAGREYEQEKHPASTPNSDLKELAKSYHETEYVVKSADGKIMWKWVHEE